MVIKDGRATDGRATLATVADAAGVSVATVSKVLNGRRDVAPATRALVQDLLHSHDYVVRGNVPTRLPTVALVFHGDLNADSTELRPGVVSAGKDLEVAVVVTHRPRGRQPRRPRPVVWAGDLVAAGCQAVITVVDALSPAEVTALAKARVPLVVIDPTMLPDTRVTSVGATNFSGALGATQHLLGLGHRRIAYLGGIAAAASNQARLQGYRGAMEAAGAPGPDGYGRAGYFTYENGLTEGTALLDLPAPPTAVFAGSDEMALGVIEAARVRGCRVPEDLSVVGFDDTQAARLASPPLTTVRQPLREIGAVALRQALRLAAGEKVDSYHIELATELVVRSSTASVR